MRIPLSHFGNQTGHLGGRAGVRLGKGQDQAAQQGPLAVDPGTGGKLSGRSAPSPAPALLRAG